MPVFSHKKMQLLWTCLFVAPSFFGIQCGDALDVSEEEAAQYGSYYGLVGIGNDYQYLVPRPRTHVPALMREDLDAGVKIVVSGDRIWVSELSMTESDNFTIERDPLNLDRHRPLPDDIDTLLDASWFKISLGPGLNLEMQSDPMVRYDRFFRAGLITRPASYWMWPFCLRRKGAVARRSLHDELDGRYSNELLGHAARTLICHFFYGGALYVPYENRRVYAEGLLHPYDYAIIARSLFRTDFIDDCLSDDESLEDITQTIFERQCQLVRFLARAAEAAAVAETVAGKARQPLWPRLPTQRAPVAVLLRENALSVFTTSARAA